MKIRIAGVVEESITDGVGYRYTVFTQGCLHQCHGCHNDSTWDIEGGTLIDIDELISNILKLSYLNGVTISGGDPFIQPAELLYLVKGLKEHGINIWVYTGFIYEDLLSSDINREILKYIDVLVDGPYIQNQRCLEKRFKGSLNQRIIDIPKTLNTGELVLYIDE